MQNLGVAFEPDPKGAKITCPAFWLVLVSSRIFHNGTYCVGFDESCTPSQSRVSGRLDQRNL